MARGKEYCTAIDLGHAHVQVATLLRTPKGALSLVKTTEAEVPRPVAGQNVEDLPSRQGVALKDALKRHGGATGRLITCLPRHLVAARRAVLPSVHRDEIEGMAHIEAERQMPFPPNEAEISYQVIDQVGDTESHVMIVGAAQKDLLAHMAVVESAGEEPDVIDVSTLGAGSAFLSRVAEGETVAVISLGRQVTEISILRGNHVVETRSSFWAERKLSAQAASQAADRDTLRIEPEASLSSEGVASWVEHLAGELRRTFVAFQHETWGSAVTRVIICGGLANQAAVVTGLEQKLDAPVEVGHVPKSLFESDNNQSRGPEYATAIGLALRGLYYKEGCINLVPRTVVEQHQSAHHKRFYTNLACLFLALVFLGGATFYVKWLQLDRERDRLTAELADWRPRVAEISASEDIYKELNYRLDKDHAAVAVLYDVWNRVKAPATITEFSFEKRDSLTLKGEVHSEAEANELVKLLSESPHFVRNGVFLRDSRVRTAPSITQTIVEYNISCRLLSSEREERRSASTKRRDSHA